MNSQHTGLTFLLLILSCKLGVNKGGVSRCYYSLLIKERIRVEKLLKPQMLMCINSLDIYTLLCPSLDLCPAIARE